MSASNVSLQKFHDILRVFFKNVSYVSGMSNQTLILEKHLHTPKGTFRQNSGRLYIIICEIKGIPFLDLATPMHVDSYGQK